MSPVMIRALLEIHALPRKTDHSDAVNGSTTTELLNLGLIEDMRVDSSDGEVVLGEDDTPYNTTSKGKCYINALINLPIPEQVWVIPDE